MFEVSIIALLPLIFYVLSKKLENVGFFRGSYSAVFEALFVRFADWLEFPLSLLRALSLLRWVLWRTADVARFEFCYYAIGVVF